MPLLYEETDLFVWSGYKWIIREGRGDPSNNLWLRDNVVLNSDDSVTLHIRDGGSAQIMSEKEGFGYGLYKCVVDGRIDLLGSHGVFGGMYTYDNQNPPGYTEIDMNEASAWGGTGPVRMQHGYWHDGTVPPSQGAEFETFVYPSGVSLTSHECEWSPGKLVFRSYTGGDFNLDNLLKETTHTGSLIPVPTAEIMNFSVWRFQDQSVSDRAITLKSFSFDPA